MNPNQRIKKYRQEMGLTQLAAARRWGISQGHLSDIEREVKPVGPYVAHKIECVENGQLQNLWEPKTA